MPYPSQLTPSSKHDLIGPPFNKDTKTLSPQFTSADEILQVLKDRKTNNNPQQPRPEKIAVVYGYDKDRCGPKDYPPSKILEILGYFKFRALLPTLASSSFSFDYDDPSLLVGGGNGSMSSFHIGVKRVDDDMVRNKLMSQRPKEVHNSDRLALFCDALRNKGGDDDNDDDGDALCAILNYDKYERISLVKAMDREEDGSNYAAHCFMTKLDGLEKLLAAHDTNGSSGDHDANDGGGTPPSSPQFDAGSGGGTPPSSPFGTASGNGFDDAGTINNAGGCNDDAGLWQPPGATSESMDASNTNGGGNDALWLPPGMDDGNDTSNNGDSTFPSDSNFPQDSAFPQNDYDFNTNNNNDDANEQGDGTAAEFSNTKTFHANKGASAADEFYSNLTRDLGTRADSILYHMRNYNGWVKATQIAELDPKTNSNNNTIDDVDGKRKKKRRRGGGGSNPLRVLDLACGKGGDLNKWTLHTRKIQNYVGIDVAGGSLVDAAIRARKIRGKLGGKCVFTRADLGADVPGRPKNANRGKMQKLLSWSMANEREDEESPPVFERVEGGGVGLEDKFDVVSIQFAIHYMMQTRKRARRFFHTVSQLLDVGGNLIATTIDARVVLDHLMKTGYDLHFDVDKGTNATTTPTNPNTTEDDEHLVVSVGEGACQLKFERKTVQKMFAPNPTDEELFGLEYTFTLVEGKDHAAGVGQAVNLPEWLIPLPVLNELAMEAGLSLEYASNFHEFFNERKDPVSCHTAHNALYSMSVLNRDGRISEQEWDISRMYMAVRYRKDRESTIVLDEEEEDDDEDEEDEEKTEIPAKSPAATPSATSAPKKKTGQMFMMAMMKAKKSRTPEIWSNLTAEERTVHTNAELDKMMNS